MMGQYWNEFGAFGMGFGWLFMIVSFGLVLLAAFTLLRWLATGDAGAARKSALEILQERYARGEIGREEYEQKRRDLEGKVTNAAS